MPECAHEDIRAWSLKDENRTAVACFKCGRLFGWLRGEEFLAHNPQTRESKDEGVSRDA